MMTMKTTTTNTILRRILSVRLNDWVCVCVGCIMAARLYGYVFSVNIGIRIA